jgi:hypothetical protein
MQGSFPFLPAENFCDVIKHVLQVAGAITGVSEYNKELVQKYQKEMRLRKKYHNELVELKGMVNFILIVT